jgi:hypothetical protein
MNISSLPLGIPIPQTGTSASRDPVAQNRATLSFLISGKNITAIRAISTKPVDQRKFRPETGIRFERKGSGQPMSP